MQGDFASDDDSETEYSEEYTFDAGKLLDEDLTGGGWIEYRQDADDISITAHFALAREGDWKEKRILGEYEAVLGYYDLKSKKWEFEISQY